MRHGVYSIYDTCIQSYGMPVYFVNDAQASRSFGDVVNKPAEDNAYYQHPEHYQLFYCGTFDDESGVFEVEPPVFVVAANSLVRSAG